MSDEEWAGSLKVEIPITHHPSPITRHLGLVEYLPTWAAMRDFTAQRNAATPDELWLLEHHPVYTLGLAGKPEHLLHETTIPLVKTDRGGQITYHGPGQIVVYTLLDLHRRQLGVKDLVRRLEQAVIELLGEYDVPGERRSGAPGVYVAGAKIAALGLKVKSSGSYHGLSLNVDMDLRPFEAINPCGYPGLVVTRTRDVGIAADRETLTGSLARHVLTQLGD
jgi:lipoyl(octanoyl) transferase